MGYFVIIIFTTFMGSPPEFIPVAFKSNKDCEIYLTERVKYKFENFHEIFYEDSIYLVNSIYNKFIFCKKLEYPINVTKFNNKE